MSHEIKQGKGLIVTVTKDVPVVLNWGDEVIEILRGNDYKGDVTLQIKASKDVGITGAHLLQKMIFERQKLNIELENLRKENEYLIDQRIKERSNDH